MKMDVNTEAAIDSRLIPLAANDGEISAAAAHPLRHTAPSWTPYDVWRTRILPYQRRLRAAATAAAGDRAEI